MLRGFVFIIYTTLCSKYKHANPATLSHPTVEAHLHKEGTHSELLSNNHNLWMALFMDRKTNK